MHFYPIMKKGIPGRAGNDKAKDVWKRQNLPSKDKIADQRPAILQ